MKAATAKRLAWPMVILSIALPVAGIFMESEPENASTASEIVVVVSFTIFVLSFAATGLILATRLPTNPIGWLFCGAALAWGCAAFSLGYAEVAVRQDVFLGIVPGLLMSSGWGVGIALATTFPFLLFPSGEYLSPIWRWIARLGAIAVLLHVTSVVLKPGRVPDFGVENPVGVGTDPGPFNFVNGATLVGILLVALAGVFSLIIRFRRSHAEQRQQIKFLLYAGIVTAIGMVIGGIVESQTSQSATAINYTNAFITVVLCAIPVGMAVGVLKYRLYDIDVVINKTIVFGVLAVFITGIYVAIVVGIGTLLGSQDEPNLALSIAATAIVAIAFSPVKERTQRLANRLVYGHRLSPYEVLTDLSRAVARAPSPNDVLVSVAHAASVGVNAKEARVLLRMRDGTGVEERFPPGSPDQVVGEVFEVMHEAETLGQISVTKASADPLTPQDRRLLEDLSGQAGLAFYNARLAMELKARLDEISAQADELQRSRGRIVSAADDARRRLERDISQGPRKDLVALREQLESALAVVETDPEAAARDLESLIEDANRTLDALRELARGIYPPLLADKGIVAAIESHIRKRDLDIEIRTDDEIRAARFDETIETAAYFCCVEALDRNGVAVIDMALSRGELQVEIHGGGRDGQRETMIGDRIEAQAGTVERRLDSLVFRLPVVERAEPQAEAVVHASSSSSGPN